MTAAEYLAAVAAESPAAVDPVVAAEYLAAAAEFLAVAALAGVAGSLVADVLAGGDSTSADAATAGEPEAAAEPSSCHSRRGSCRLQHSWQRPQTPVPPWVAGPGPCVEQGSSGSVQGLEPGSGPLNLQSFQPRPTGP